MHTFLNQNYYFLVISFLIIPSMCAPVQINVEDGMKHGIRGTHFMKEFLSNQFSHSFIKIEFFFKDPLHPINVFRIGTVTDKGILNLVNIITIYFLFFYFISLFIIQVFLTQNLPHKIIRKSIYFVTSEDDNHQPISIELKILDDLVVLESCKNSPYVVHQILGSM